MKNLGHRTEGRNSRSINVKVVSTYMCGKIFVAFLVVLSAAGVFMASAADSAPPRRYSYADTNDAAIREMRDTLDDLRHEATNNETEIRAFEEKLNNLDAILDSMRKQINDSSQASKEQLKSSTANLEVRVSSLESTAKGLAADLRQIKNYANDSNNALAQNKQKIHDLEKIVEAQNQNIENLQSALRSLMDALQAKDGEAATSPSGKTYRVKAGDSLEKIARANQTTIEAIKQLNNLSGDRIIVGQKLQLPEN